MYSGNRLASHRLSWARPTKTAVHVLAHDVGDEPTVPWAVFPHHHRRLTDVRVGGQRRLHLSRFNPESAHLHLVVDPPCEHQLTARQPPHQIPGPVHPLNQNPRTGHATNRSAVSVG